MYFTNLTEVQARLLSNFGIEVTLGRADLDYAESSVSRLGPFVGARYDPNQADDFPRSVTLEGDVEGAVPDVVLDFVALRAATLADSENVTALSGMSRGLDVLRRSENYARPKLSKMEVYLRNALARVKPYQRQTGELI